MKPTTALLAASLVANAGLLALVATRSPSPSSPGATSVLAGARPVPSTSHDTLRAALASGDLAALEAAGLSRDAARELILGRTLARVADRLRAARDNPPANERWWRTNRAGASAAHELQLQNRREISDALVAAFGEDLGLFAPAGSNSQLGFLSPAKRDALRRITQDYDEMMAKFSANGIQLASDKERLKLLAAERDRDIAALLSPAEREAYEMRMSRTAQNVRARYGEGIETEDDYRKIYALQKAFDEKFPLDAAGGRLTPDLMRQRGEAQRQLQDDVRASLGDEKYAALRRATDSDLRNVDSLVARLNLPSSTTDRIATARESLAIESQRINADTSLTVPQRREQIQQLAARAKSELTQSLGAEAADAYAPRSPWVSMLQNGMAYTTTPSASSPALALGGLAPSVQPVPPAGATGPGNVRQTFSIAAPMATTDFVTSDVPVGTPATGVQVMTFSTSETNSTTPASGSAQRVMVIPKSDAAPGIVAPTPKP